MAKGHRPGEQTGVKSGLNKLVRCFLFGLGIVFGLLAVIGEIVIQNARPTWDSLTKRKIREMLAPVMVEGIQGKVHSKGSAGHSLATDFDEESRPEVFGPSTAIISNGYGLWELRIPQDVRKSLIDITLKIETIRTHGILHSPRKGASASVFFNDQLVDRIYLVKPHPHGEDYGVDSRRPFPVFRYINRDFDIQTVKVTVDEDAKWDIDRLTLEPIVLRKVWKPEATMVIGALISAVIGAIVNYLK